MKFGLQAIHSWSTGPGVENVSQFLLDLAIEAEEAGVTWRLDGIFGLRFNEEKAIEPVRRDPPHP